MADRGRRLRVVVWSTGGVGSRAIAAIGHRPDLELVGVWVHSPDKVGRDAGVLAGGAPIGIAASADAEALLALRPDCVVYAASGPERDAAAMRDYLRILGAGINLVTVTSTQLIYPPTYPEPGRSQLEAAAMAGGVSLYASGIFPGFTSDQLALALATQSSRIRRITLRETALYDHYPVADMMTDGMGFGRPLDFTPLLAQPGVIATMYRTSIDLVAAGLGWQVEDVRGELDRAASERRLEVAFGAVEAGSCGAVRSRAIGIVEGREAIVVEHLTRMARDVAPHWPAPPHDATYVVAVEGEPDMTCTVEMGAANGEAAADAAMLATAMRVVNAIPYVVAAPAGLLSSLDLPLTVPRPAPLA